MKKAIVIALFCLTSIAEANAQLIKQTIYLSLTGYTAPETSTTIGYVTRLTPKAFSITDRAICFQVAHDNNITVKYPQLIRVADISGNFIGYYLTDSGKVVADAGNYISRVGHDYNVSSGTEIYSPYTDQFTVTDLSRAYSTWSLGLMDVSGLDTTNARFTFPSSDFESKTFSMWNFSAPISGGFTNSDTGTRTCCSGTIRATSAIVKSIPGLP
ncbi:MAG: hypothetical protein ACXWBP_07810 [Limisphaerales bacterium]